MIKHFLTDYKTAQGIFITANGTINYEPKVLTDKNGNPYFSTLFSVIERNRDGAERKKFIPILARNDTATRLAQIRSGTQLELLLDFWPDIVKLDDGRWDRREGKFFVKDFAVDNPNQAQPTVASLINQNQVEELDEAILWD